MELKYKTISRELWKIAIPISMQAMLVALVSFIDNLFIGHLDNVQSITAGLNSVGQLSFISSILVTSFIGGISIFFLKSFGENDAAGMIKFFHIKIVWTIILSIIVLVVCMIFLKPISSLWIAKDGNYNLSISAAYDYGIYALPSLAFTFITFTITSAYKSTKQTKIIFWLALVSVIINSSLNYPFIYTLNMGVMGSSVATLITRFITAFIWIGYLLKNKPKFLGTPESFFALKLRDILSVFSKAASWTLSSLLTTSAFIVQMYFLSNISSSVGSSLNIAGSFAQLVSAFASGFASAISIMIVAEIGMNRINVHEYTRKISRLAFLLGLVCGIITASLSPLLFVFYPDLSTNINIQSMIMIISISSLMWVQLVLTCFVSYLKGYGFTRSIVMFEGILPWLTTIPITLILIYVSNDIPYGFIYWIIGMTIIFKLISFTYIYRKNNSNRNLQNNFTNNS